MNTSRILILNSALLCTANELKVADFLSLFFSLNDKDFNDEISNDNNIFLFEILNKFCSLNTSAKIESLTQEQVQAVYEFFIETNKAFFDPEDFYDSDNDEILDFRKKKETSLMLYQNLSASVVAFSIWGVEVINMPWSFYCETQRFHAEYLRCQKNGNK